MRRPLHRGWLWILVVGVVLVAAVAVFLSLRSCSREEILRPSWTPPTLAEVRKRLDGKAFAQFADEAYRLHLLRHPQTITELELAAELGVRDDRLDDYSEEYVRTTQAIEREIYQRLHTFNRESLSPDERVTYDACEAFWSDLTTCEAPALSLFPLSASDDSPHRCLYDRLIASWRIAGEEDVIDYVACLHQADDQILELRRRIEALRRQHRLPPVHALDEVLRELQPLKITEMWSRSEYLPDRIVAGRNVYFVGLRETLLGIRELGIEKRVAYLAEARRALEREVIPAYEALYKALVIAIAEAPATSIGVTQRAGTGATYRALLRHYTDSDLTADAIHAAAQSAVAELTKTLQVVEEQVRLPGDRNEWGTAPWDGGEASPDDVAAACRAAIQRAEAFGAQFAGRLPQAEIRVVIGEAVRDYVPAPPGGRRPARLVVSPDALPASAAVDALVHREIIPGRHLQTATAREVTRVAIRAWGSFPAFQEGWSNYALDVAARAGLYDGDPLSELERLRSQVSDAALAVVDTGIHAFGWDLDRAAAYFGQATGSPESVARSAVKSCISSPGRATAPFVGGTRLRILRDAALRAGATSLAAFDDLVLGRGLLPLSIVERDVRKDLGIGERG